MAATALRDTPNPLEWVKPPHQARTRESLTRLLDAAEALVAVKGFSDSGISEIARRAGASVGGFYRRFRDKQGLLQALHERFCEEARATADAALDPARWAGTPTPEVMAEFTRFLVQIHREREGAFRAFLQSAAEDEIVRQRTEALIAYLHDRLRALLAGRRADIGHPDPDLAGAVGLNVLLGSLTHAIQLRPAELGLADPRLPDELTRAFLAYLQVRPARD